MGNMKEIIQKLKVSGEIPPNIPTGITRKMGGVSAKCRYPDGTECRCDCGVCPCSICTPDYPDD
jgi:hypothetical protein